MEELREGILRKQKSVDVTYVPDFDVLKIVKPFGSKTTDRINVEKSKKSTETASPVVTKSGRKVLVKKFITKSKSKTLNESENESDEEASFPLPEITERPTRLFDEEDKDVAPNEVFGFCTPKKRHGMVKKASESVTKKKDSASSKESEPSKRENEIEYTVPKTPYSLRRRLKEKIKKEVTKVEEDLFEWSGSEYAPSDSSSECNESEDDTGVTPLSVVPRTVKHFTSNRKYKTKPNYVFTSDDYFESRSGKSLTSDHTLGKLKNPSMGQEQLSSLLSNYNPRHKSYIKALNKHTSAFFDRWLYSLKEGFNVLVIGLGSKRTLLHWFHQTYLSSSLVLVINGYFPSLTIKEVIDSLCELIGVRGNETIEGVFNRLDSQKKRVFLIIHNLDGPMFRSDKAQTTLASLASHSKIHVVASIDHINAPLLWDQKKLSKYNFIWEDGTSYLPYKEETNFESSMMVQRSGTLALAALKNVFQSLTNNSRNIFKILLNHQLESNSKQSGMQFSDLYRACRNNFVVSSDLALRTQLTEFLDHQLLKWKKESDILTIPVEMNVLKQFKNEIESEE